MTAGTGARQQSIRLQVLPLSPPCGYRPVGIVTWHAGQDPGPGAVRAAGPDALPQPEFRGSRRAG